MRSRDSSELRLMQPGEESDDDFPRGAEGVAAGCNEDDLFIPEEEKNFPPPRIRPGFLFFLERKVENIRGVHANYYEPHRGYEDGLASYFAFAFAEVVDPSRRFFDVLLEQYGATPLLHHHRPVWNKKLHPLKSLALLFFGLEDLYHFKGRGKGFLIFAYVICLGWVLSPLMNLVKLPAELLIKMLAEFLCFLKDSLVEKYDTKAFLFTGAFDTDGLRSVTNVKSFKNLRSRHKLPYLFLGFLQHVLELARIILRMITSPIESAKAGWNSGYESREINSYLGFLSLTGSFLLWMALCFAAGPFAAMVAAKLGFSFAMFSHVQGLTTLSAPVMNFLVLGGYVSQVSAALTGAVAFITPVLLALGLNEVRRCINELLSHWIPEMPQDEQSTVDVEMKSYSSSIPSLIQG